MRRVQPPDGGTAVTLSEVINRLRKWQNHLKGKVELGKTREIHKQAHFTTMDFDAAPKVLEPLREHLEQNPEILRYRILGRD